MQAKFKGQCHKLGLEPIASDEVVLLSPLPAFWEAFKASEFYDDGKPDPLDRYSKTIINPLAKGLEVEAVFPSDGPPYSPFISWALKAEGVYASPIGLLVHDQFGLFISFRGALKMTIEKRESQSPCINCARPCVSACPVNAFANGLYDDEACKAHLRSGNVDCWKGCLARKVCPANKILRSDEQNAFHMRSFVD